MTKIELVKLLDSYPNDSTMGLNILGVLGDLTSVEYNGELNKITLCRIEPKKEEEIEDVLSIPPYKMRQPIWDKADKDDRFKWLRKYMVFMSAAECLTEANKQFIDLDINVKVFLGVKI